MATERSDSPRLGGDMPTVAGERVVYVHAEKTAGRYVARVLRDLGVAVEVGSFRAHARFKDIAEHVGDRWVLGTVRGPWQWLASFYTAQLARGMEGWLGPYIRAAGGDAFGPVVRAMVDPLGMGVRAGGYHGAPVEMLDCGVSLYAHIMREAYMEWGTHTDERIEWFGPDIVIDADQATAGLAEALRVCGYDLTEAQLAAMEGEGRVGESAWSHDVRELYDDELAAMVYDRCRWWCDMFGLRFGGSGERACQVRTEPRRSGWLAGHRPIDDRATLEEP